MAVVVPCMTAATSDGARPSCPRQAVIASMIPSERSTGVVGTFVVATIRPRESRAVRSVKVPPVSIPTVIGGSRAVTRRTTEESRTGDHWSARRAVSTDQRQQGAPDEHSGPNRDRHARGVRPDPIDRLLPRARLGAHDLEQRRHRLVQDERVGPRTVPVRSPGRRRESCAEPRGRFDGITLAINLERAEDVQPALDAAVAAGGTLLKPATAADWGGVSGYFADPDGHAWEIAWNPFFPLGPDGRLDIP